MKCHIGVAAGSGPVHTMTVTVANEHDISQNAKFLREDKEVVCDDVGCLGILECPEIANGEHFSKIDFRITCYPDRLPYVYDNSIERERYIEHRKSSVRCKVEHVFQINK